MSARKLAALVIKLVFLYLAVTSFFNALMVLASLPFAEGLYERFGYINAVAVIACTFIFFGCLIYGDRLARWIIREDWTIASEAADGAVFWSRTVPVLMVMGTGILVIGTSASELASAIPLCVAIVETPPVGMSVFPYPIADIVKQLLGPLLSLAVGAYLFLRPGGLLKLFQRYGKAD